MFRIFLQGEESKSASTLDLKSKSNNNTTTSKTKRTLGRVFSLQHFNDNNALFRDNSSDQQNEQLSIKNPMTNSYVQSSIDISTQSMGSPNNRLRRVLSTPEPGANTVINALFLSPESFPAIE